MNLKGTFEIKQIAPEDKIPLQTGMKMLSPESRRQRFFGQKESLSDSELSYLTEVDQDNHIAYAAYYQEGENKSPAGVARAIKKTEKNNYAEIAIVIIDKYHGNGLGFRLLNEVANRALEVGISHFCGEFHASNTKMLKLLEKFAKNQQGLNLRHSSNGFIYFELGLK